MEINNSLKILYLIHIQISPLSLQCPYSYYFKKKNETKPEFKVHVSRSPLIYTMIYKYFHFPDLHILIPDSASL